jgi:hypothetical protein
MVEADVVYGRTLASWPTVTTDLGNAGGRVGQEVVTNQGLVPGGPDDLPALCAKVVEEFAEGKYRYRLAASRPDPGCSTARSVRLRAAGTVHAPWHYGRLPRSGT